MDASVYTRPNKPRRLAVKQRGQVTAPVAPAVLPALRLDRDSDCFVTPSTVAEKMVRYLAVEHAMPILEPSAGTGQLVQALLDAGLASDTITVVEKNPALWAFMRQRMAQGFNLDSDNLCFLAYAAARVGRVHFPRILMNPPFSKGQTAQHVEAALSLLGSAGCDNAVLIALVPSTYEHVEAVELEALPAGTFSGTAVRTKIIRIER